MHHKEKNRQVGRGQSRLSTPWVVYIAKGWDDILAPSPWWVQILHLSPKTRMGVPCESFPQHSSPLATLVWLVQQSKVDENKGN
jgi:hypothetical protein